MSVSRMPSGYSSLSRRSSYFSAQSTVADGDIADDEAFFLSPRSKSQRDATSDVGFSPGGRHTRPRTLSALSGMSGMSGFSESSTAGGLSDSWASAGGKTYVDVDHSGDEKEDKDNVVSELGLTRSISSALVMPSSPSRITRRAMSYDSRPAGPSSMNSSISMPASTPMDGSLDFTEKPTLSTLLAHLDPGSRTSSYFVSSSMSFYYALWEAVRRYRVNVKHDVEIAIMDGREFVEDEGTRRVWTVNEMMNMKDAER